MTDELYDYFGGNASKKVEPIEDDELETTEPESSSDAPEQAEAAEPIADTAEPVLDDTPATEPEPIAEATEEAAPEAEPAPKGGHWDFLANMLGIGGGKSEPKKPQAVAPAAEPVVEAQAPEATDEVATDQAELAQAEKEAGDFFGFDPIPALEQDTPLPSMFTSSDSTEADNELQEDSEPVAEESEEEVASTNTADDLIGWQPVTPKSKAKELEPSQSEYSPKPKRAPKSEPVEASLTAEADEAIDGEEYVEFEIEELDNSPYTEGEEEARGRSRRRPRRDSNEDDSAPRGRSRGSRQRGRGRDSDRDSDRDRDRNRDRDRQPRRRREEEISAKVKADDFDDDRDSRPESDDDRTKKKRRRRRRKPRSSEASDDVRDRDDSATDDEFDSSEPGTAEFAREEAKSRGGRRQRGRSSGSERRTESKESGSGERKKRAKVPTWDEAISVMIESNIKNHEKSGGGGRNRKRNSKGRRR